MKNGIHRLMGWKKDRHDDAQYINSFNRRLITMDQNLKQRCLVCCEEIQTGARKCIRCDSYQDWRRFLFFGNTLLSLLIAFLSVSAITLPVIIKYINGDYSNVQLSYFVFTETGIGLVLNNNGTKPGTLKSCKVNLINKNNPQIIIQSFTCDLDHRYPSRIINPSGVSDLYFTINTPLFFKQKVLEVTKGDISLVNNGDLEIWVEVEILQYNKKDPETIKNSATVAKDLFYMIKA
jgi:hypothetical protein